jgi:hypothetical protein
MPFHKFEDTDVFYNRIKTHPQTNLIIYNGNLYLNNKSKDSGSFVNNAGMVPTGYVNLYELNVDRKSDNKIYPFVTKDGSLYSFSTISTSKFNSDFLYGDQITGSYPMSASISSYRYPLNQSRARIESLKNALNSYKVLSPSYAYSSSYGDKATQELRLVSIPSIFYGSSIQKGTVSCKFYVSGNLIAELRDDAQNGQLRQVSSSYDGATTTASSSVAGVVMYNEGFLVLTGSWYLSDAHTENYTGGGAAKPRWIDFATTGSGIPSSSFSLNFSGTNYVPTLTMLAQAPVGMVNFSNNPTFIEKKSPRISTASFGKYEYHEVDTKNVKNIVSSSFEDPEPEFEKTVYINHIGIYDEDRNLIAIAKTANPVRKRTQDDFTFKLKLDF